MIPCVVSLHTVQEKYASECCIKPSLPSNTKATYLYFIYPSSITSKGFLVRRNTGISYLVVGQFEALRCWRQLSFRQGSEFFCGSVLLCHSAKTKNETWRSIKPNIPGASYLILLKFPFSCCILFPGRTRTARIFLLFQFERLFISSFHFAFAKNRTAR